MNNPMNENNKPTYLDVALEGMNLLEASAGTGKTFTVALLYLRGLLGIGTPQNVPLKVAQILVVTFTNAATEELIARIRQRIKQAIRYIDQPADDQALIDVLEEAYPKLSKEKCKETLQIAISQISFAKISTIHSFCIDVCNSVAIDSGLPLGLTLSIDSEVIEQPIQDLWRQNIEVDDGYISSMLDSYKKHHDLFSKLLKINFKEFSKDSFDFDLPGKDFYLKYSKDTFFNDFQNAFNDGLDIKNFIENNESYLHKTFVNGVKTKFLKINDFLKKQSELEYIIYSCFSLDHIVGKIYKSHLDKKDSIIQQLKSIPLVKFCDELVLTTSQKISFPDIPYFNQILNNFNQRLFINESKHSEVYADRLIQLAADVSENPQVAKLMRDSLPLAIIDEFQDTDPFQYQLFNNIYQGDNCGLLMVGDPKQAIYTFRGGDIYTYLKAQKKSQKTYDLGDNYRSTKPMVESINAIFTQVKGEHKNEEKGPFQHKEISFKEVNSKANKAAIRVKQSNTWSDLKAVHGEYLIENQKATLPSNYRKKLIAATSVDYVAKLIGLADSGKCLTQDDAKSPERPLRRSDIVFLVNGHSEAKLIKAALLELNIASLTQGRESIFKEAEAYDCWLILRAMLEPTNHRYFETAIHAKINGLGYKKVYEIMNDDKVLQLWSESFHELHETLTEQGPMVAMSSWFSLIGSDTKFMQIENDRQATNVMQLLEILQEEHAISGGGYKLLNKLEQSIATADASDEKLLRLESDEDRVKIITIHAAKGLEYPVVLVPFAWNDYIYQESKPYSAHNEKGELLIGFSKELQDQQKEELIAEKLRLFYVALTRASQHLILYFIDNGKKATAKKGPQPSFNYNKSPLGWYFPTLVDTDTVSVAFQNFKTLLEPMNENTISLDDIDVDSKDNVSKNNEPKDNVSKDSKEKKGLKFEGEIINYLGISSFSAMTRGYDMGTKGAEEDEGENEAENEGENETKQDIKPIGRHALVKGAHIGTALHNVLEHTVFTKWKATDLKPAQLALEQQTSYELKSNGVIYHKDALESETVKYTKWLREVINTPFLNIESSENNNQDTKALKDLTKWFPELTFTFKLSKKFGKDALKTELSKHGYNLSGLSGHSVKGMLTGAIDLVFEEDGKYYLADYKSNYLGVDYQAYDQESLAYNNDKKAYTLQYLIYTLALHKHLKTRLINYDYKKHFGGVFYLYIRGMHPDKQHLGKGVFYHVPSLAVVEALDQLICGEIS